MQFIDKARIVVKAGNGGDGAASFHREKYVARGGPSGGDGGRGGSVTFVADARLTTLLDFKYQRHFRAENGENGKAELMSGRDGKDMAVRVPVGTIVRDVGTGAIIVISYVIRELPVGVEAGIASLKQIDPAIEEAAADLGADTPTVFRTIVLPLIRPAFISSLSYTFVRSMTAVSAVIFLISARWYHLTVLIYNFSENLRFGLASVLASTLIVIVLLTFGLLRLLVRKNENLAKTMSL